MTEIRFINEDEVPTYLDAITIGFGDDPKREDGDIERFLAVNPIETCIAAFDRSHTVATFGSYDLDLTVPGGQTLATAGTTHVTVHPTHRRRGLLTEMMRLHLDQARDRGQPMAALWASEERIYGRFGYGPAGWRLDLRAPAFTLEAPPPADGITVHPLTLDEATAVLPALFEDRRLAVAGRFARSDQWWQHRRFHDHAHRQGDARSQRFVVAELDGEPVGYLAFRLSAEGEWEEGQTNILELVTGNESARRALWHFATNVDLYRNVRWWNAPVDEPLLVETSRFRSITRTVGDSIWLRPLDVTALLEGRRYEHDGTVVIGVDDPMGYAGGRYRLEVEGGRAQCTPVRHDADVHLGVAELGRLYLGGDSAVTLHRAGRLDGAAACVALVDDLFRTRHQPHCIEVF
ncbi:MAG: GNAT family N-acetyltransferase [Actinomycetota bacterium]